MELGDEQDVSLTRIPCQFCGRKFAPESLGKHANVCEKTSNRKRKTFDSAKQRIQGTELAEFVPTETIKRHDPVATIPVKEKHIPTSKVVDTVHNVPSRKSNKTTSPLNKSSNYERCPYCDRSFGPKAFDRHLEWCKEQSIRINLKSNATQEAKERLEARTKYRAPSFKSKRSITKEKYSPKLKNPEPRTGSISIKNDEIKGKANVMCRSYENEVKLKAPIICDKPKPKENKEVNFIRQNVIRCSYKTRLPKKGESKADKEKINNSFHNAKNTDLSVGDWISANGIKIEPAQPPCKVSPTNSLLTNSIYDDYDPFALAENQMRELFGDSNIPFDLNSDQILYSPNPKRPLKEERLQKVQNKENISYEQRLQQQQQKQCGPIQCKSGQTAQEQRRGGGGGEKQLQPHFKTSPTSAFSKYTAPATTALNGGGDKNYVRVPTPVPATDLLDKEEYNFLPPIVNNHANARYDNSGAHEILNQINRYPLISLSNLSLCSSVSVDMPDDGHHHQTPQRRMVGAASSSSSCCRNADLSCSSVNSVASVADGVPVARIPVAAARSLSTQSSNEKSSSASSSLSKNQKKSLRMEQMLYGGGSGGGNGGDGSAAGEHPPKEKTRAGTPLTPDMFDEKLNKLNNFLDADDFDLMNSFAEFENVLQNSCCDRGSASSLFLRDGHSPDDKLSVKLERGDSIASKMSIDSAYNSLNRKSPILCESSHFTGITSTPELHAMKSSPLSPTSDFQDSQLQTKLSKFCHECGAKFPLAIAKFCCECGVRRLAI